MELVRGKDRTRVWIDSAALVDEGGEGKIVGVQGSPDLVAKIYHPAKRTPERAAKLRAMLASPPADPTASQGHASIAWPLDILLDPATGDTVGFLMRRSPFKDTVFTFYNPGQRRAKYPDFTYRYLVAVASNIATAVHALHEKGYVLGDVNQGNILVSNQSLVTLVDTDSFQVPDRASGRVLRCTVYVPEFTPPELQGQDLTKIDRTPQHDAFGLGILLFHLLMEGFHPFINCRFTGTGEPPEVVERIRSGHFPYSRSRTVPWTPSPGAVPFEVLDPELGGLLLQCFDAGHHDPRARPTARQWQNALRAAGTRMLRCSVNGQHWFGNHLSQCPWCERTALLGGRDPFPSEADFRAGKHLAPVRRQPVAPQPQAAVPTPQPIPQPARPVAQTYNPPISTPAKTSPVYLWVGGGIVALALVLFSMFGPWSSNSTPAPTLAQAPAKVARVIPPNAVTNPVDGQVYVWVPPGKFTMGCSNGDGECYPDESPAHPVTISKGFHMGQTEVTQAAYQKVIGSNPSTFKGDDLPVEQVSWNEADAYCKKVGGRLPTEAEWEYAARGNSAAARYGTLEEIAWFSSNSGSKTHPVAGKPANVFGLHDMLGNVWEWTADWYADKYESGNTTDPKGPQSGSEKALRGGSWFNGARYARVSDRYWVDPALRDSNDGFRCVGE